ncbi:hypothetical protein GJ744_010358 [Endocarpon pusillum]|uniref:Uncharacterized protein n=1 Tax=Endocarpon pusillum TaxID=364733 RepID=A0A8H7E321_9EURO|nr:hypothetical protein GJ744_010358 [Endocarpon pusillum]
MAEWKERGYVPDSDDEEDEGLELLSPNAEQQRDACFIENDYSILLAGAQHDDPIRSEVDLRECARQVEVDQDEGGLEEDKQLQDKVLPKHDSELIDQSQIERPKESVAEQLQDELRSGLDIVKEVLSGLSTAIEGHRSSNESSLSSPLSSIESFSAGDHSGTPPEDKVTDIPLPLDHRSSEYRFAPSAGNDEHRVDDLHYAAHVTRRNLRQRNPIQLHPYALEGARYQQELLARGLRPVYVDDLHRRRTSDICESQDCKDRENDAGQSTQETTFSQQETSGPLQPIHNEANRRRPRRPSANSLASDEELPELDAILEAKHGRLPTPRKRSKAVYNALRSKRTLSHDHEFHTYDAPFDAPTSTLGESPSGAIFQVPPSPPRTRSVQSSQSTEVLPRSSKRNQLARYRRRTPQTLPTPNISSTAQQPTDQSLQCNSGSNSPENCTAESVGDSSQHSVEQDDSQIFRLQRKTKGVLPASFFRLQGQQEKTRSNPIRSWSSSPDRDIDTLGVAHSVSRLQNRQNSPSRASHDAIVVSDDSSPEEEPLMGMFDDPAVSNFSNNTLPSRRVSMMCLTDGDIEEDNGIDIMMQPKSRKRKAAVSRGKRQRLVSEFGRDMDSHPRHELSQRKPKRHKGHSFGLQWPKPNNSTVKALSLGPLDAPGYKSLPRMKQPQFLRLAARRARSRTRGGRQSPSRKCIRLATSADTEEANSELNNWRKGLLEQNTKASLNAKPRKSTQQDNLPPGSSLAQRLHRLPVLESEEYMHSQGRGPNDRRQSEQSLPPRHRTEDLIRDILLRQTGQSIQSSNHSKKNLFRTSNNGSAKPRDAQFESLHHFKSPKRVLNAFGGHSNSSQFERIAHVATTQDRHEALPTGVEDPTDNDLAQDASRQALFRPHRKRTPKQSDLVSLSPAWALELSGLATGLNDNNDLDALSGVVLAGLGSPEFPITRDFGVVPFAEGVCLHDASFVGEDRLSDLTRNLVLNCRNLFQSKNSECVVIRPSTMDSPYRWGVWDDQVSQQFPAWFLELRGCLGFHASDMANNPPQNTLTAFKTLTRYLSHQVSFQDRQSLAAFAEVATRMAKELVDQVVTQLESSLSAVPPNMLQLSSLLLVFIVEIACIVASALMNHKLQTELCETFKTLAVVVLKALHRDNDLEKLTNIASSSSKEPELINKSSEIDALVVIHNLSKEAVLHIDIWDLVTEALSSSIGFQPENLVTFRDYDGWWKGVLLTLPWLDLDASGQLHRTFTSPGWDLIQRLLIRFLQLFMPRRHKASYSTKHYGRVLVHRCFDLVQLWGWEGGHAVIGTLFDAYSSNDFKEMFGETPENRFCLSLNLAPGVSVHVGKTDSGFHAFLGLIAQTIVISRKPDANPKLAKRVLRSLSARLVPNKGEDLPKNKTPSCHNIIALRNRFDLVSVMHCVMPAELKPNLRLLQSFVDFPNAHREACRIALECWLRLVQHELFNEQSADTIGQKASDTHPHPTLLLLREWHDSIVMDLLASYTSESHETMGLDEHRRTDNAELCKTLSFSRRPSADIIIDALKTWQQSFEFCQTTSQATALLGRSTLREILKYCETKVVASNILVSAALQIISAYTQYCLSRIVHAGPTDEDSQEYGTWDHFDNMELDGQTDTSSDHEEFSHLQQEVHPMLWRFLSNIFGNDTVPDHTILKSTVDCWFEVAHALVRLRARGWDDFMGQYSTYSWESLRHTQQSQQYKIYFLTKVVDASYGFYEKDRLRVLTIWISSLCRPKRALLWEPLLTSTILFHDPENELLFNPPFAVRSDAGEKLEISKSELCERRTAMIYVLLRNMHRLIAISSTQPSHPYNKSEFCEILKSMETTMKASYQDLSVDQQAQDEYRVFLNSVIQQMQLYVVDFHKIDAFLTDPAIFSAESYAITATLKRYSLMIQTTGVTKAMVLFLYNANERAAISDTQDQFILQLCDALLDLSPESIELTENHDSVAALLTSLLQNVFPVYVRYALSAPGHTVSRPLLRVLAYIFVNLRCRSDLWNASALQQLVTAADIMLRSAISAFQSCAPSLILSSLELLDNFAELVSFIHSAMLRTYEAVQAFPCDVEIGSLIEVLLVLKDHILAVERPSDADSYTLQIEADEDLIADVPAEPSMMRTYAEKELQNALEKTWRTDASGGWQVIGRGAPKVVKASKRTVSGAAAEMEMERCKEKARFMVREFVEAFVHLDWWE